MPRILRIDTTHLPHPTPTPSLKLPLKPTPSELKTTLATPPPTNLLPSLSSRPTTPPPQTTAAQVTTLTILIEMDWERSFNRSFPLKGLRRSDRRGATAAINFLTVVNSNSNSSSRGTIRSWEEEGQVRTHRSLSRRALGSWVLLSSSSSSCCRRRSRRGCWRGGDKTSLVGMWAEAESSRVEIAFSFRFRRFFSFHVSLHLPPSLPS